MIPTEACGDHLTTQWYLEGTQPTEICPIHSGSATSTLLIYRLEKEMYKSGQRFNATVDTTPLSFSLDFSNLSTSSTDYDENDYEQINLEKPEEYNYNYLME